MNLALDQYLGVISPKQSLQLKRLKTRHKQIIIMHLSGMDYKFIADETGYDASYISNILRCDLAQEAVDDYLKFMDQEFAALYSLAVNAVRKGLMDNDPKVYLAAADKFFKAHNKYNGTGSGESQTAEDIITRIMEMNITVTEKVPIKQPTADTRLESVCSNDNDVDCVQSLNSKDEDILDVE